MVNPTGRAHEVASVSAALRELRLCASRRRRAIGRPRATDTRTGREQLAAAANPGAFALVHCGHDGVGERLAARLAAAGHRVALPELDCVGALHALAVSQPANAFRGAFVLGCPPYRCRAREGAWIPLARLLHGRAPERKHPLDARRVRFASGGAADLGRSPPVRALRARDGLARRAAGLLRRPRARRARWAVAAATTPRCSPAWRGSRSFRRAPHPARRGAARTAPAGPVVARPPAAHACRDRGSPPTCAAPRSAARSTCITACAHGWTARWSWIARSRRSARAATGRSTWRRTSRSRPANATCVSSSRRCRTRRVPACGSRSTEHLSQPAAARLIDHDADAGALRVR